MKRNVLFFVILSIISSGLNYVTYPALAHILPSGQYIDITVALSLLTQMSTFLSSIVAITIGLSKAEEKERMGTKIELLQSMLFRLFIALGVIFLLVSPLILPKIHIPLLFVLPIFFMMIVSIPIAIISGYLNGKSKLVKLGLLTALSGVLQIVLTIAAGLLTRNGLWSMFAMGTGQLLTIPVVYLVFNNERLPRVGRTLLRPINIDRHSEGGKLFIYTLASSLAIMFINLIQIADLLIIQAQHGSGVKFYTDIYVISRVVFFGGMILIWPFLAEISLHNHQMNRKPLLKVCASFCLIALAAIIGINFFGSFITHLLFGSRFNANRVSDIGTLSILYKLFFLIITAVTLYFIVLRSYIAVWLSLAITLVTIAFAELVSKRSGLHTILFGLDTISGVAAVISLALFFIKKHELATKE